MRQLLIVIALVLVSAQASTAQEKTTKTERRQAFEQFTSQHEQSGETRWHEETGTPAALLGYEITKYKGTPRQVARAFLAEEKAMLGIEDVERDTELEKEETLAQGGTRLIYRQEYQGVPVLYSGYLIAVNDKGAINYVSGDY